jgi:hypothetical protein
MVFFYHLLIIRALGLMLHCPIFWRFLANLVASISLWEILLKSRIRSARDVEAFKYLRKLRRRHYALTHFGESAFGQLLSDYAIAGAIPPQHLHIIATMVEEKKHMTVQWVLIQNATHGSTETGKRFAHIGWL